MAFIVSFGGHGLEVNERIVGERNEGNIVAMGEFEMTEKCHSSSTEMAVGRRSRWGWACLELKLDNEALDRLCTCIGRNSHEAGGQIIHRRPFRGSARVGRVEEKGVEVNVELVLLYISLLGKSGSGILNGNDLANEIQLKAQVFRIDPSASRDHLGRYNLSTTADH
jgi:hypothetical protein